MNAAEGRPEKEREVIRVSRDRLERLLNLVGELVIDAVVSNSACAPWINWLQVLAIRIDSPTPYARSNKHTFSFQPSPPPRGEAMPQGFPGVSDFGSLEFDKYDDFNILAVASAR